MAVVTLVEMIQVQARFEVAIKELPEHIDTSACSMSPRFLFSHVILPHLIGSLNVLENPMAVGRMDMLCLRFFNEKVFRPIPIIELYSFIPNSCPFPVREKFLEVALTIGI